MKIRVNINVDRMEARKVIEVPDNASDDEKDKAALEWADSVVSVWWEDIE